MKGKLRWSDKQREIARLLADGKEFKDITAFGYRNYMVTKLKNVLAEGQNPKPKPKAEVKVKPRTKTRTRTRTEN